MKSIEGLEINQFGYRVQQKDWQNDRLLITIESIKIEGQADRLEHETDEIVRHPKDSLKLVRELKIFIEEFQ